MGANRMQTTLRVVFPAALSGIAAAIVLGHVARGRRDDDRRPRRRSRRRTSSLDPREGMQTMTGFIAQTAGGENPVGSLEYNTLFAVGLLLFVDHARDQRDQHPARPPVPAGVLMSHRRSTAREHRGTIATGESRDRDARLAGLPGRALVRRCSSACMVLLVLIVDDGHRRRAAVRLAT